MAPSDFPAEWDDPRYVATVVGVLATGVLYAYASTAKNAPTTGDITFVLLAVLAPAGVVYELARRTA
ncbi:hypothetical protein [Halobacterium jilantaiense]|uniref:Uncharacterized protein n=1 Tax=Halobacterium jilantaiense TaxID=355548 RepID=A0A1I0NB41_9EURY|nr:hypothetical protein [Halobacterium jilantaiense]SEV98426.1 hypothetical protein SAMN04487945_0736 [Halobacterium jilantaiense]